MKNIGVGICIIIAAALIAVGLFFHGAGRDQVPDPKYELRVFNAGTDKGQKCYLFLFSPRDGNIRKAQLDQIPDMY